MNEVEIVSEKRFPEDKLKELLTRICGVARKALALDGCTIFFLEADGETLMPMAADMTEFAEESLSTPIKVNNSFTGQSVRAGQALIFNDAGVIPGGFHIPGTPEETDERLLTSPFKVDNRVYGAICLRRKGPFFIGAELALVDSFTAYLGETLETFYLFQNIQAKIDELKKEENSLAVEEYYSRALDNIENAAIITKKGIIEFANDSAAKLFSVQKEKLVFGTIAGFVHNDDRERAFEHHIGWKFDDGFPHFYLIRITDKERYQKQVKVNALAIMWEGEPAVLNFLTDVTER